jgi:hypothetical protein
MPLESIQTPKAPAGWQLNPDQARRVAQDPRLQRLSRDELYLVFNQPKGQARPQGQMPRAAPAPTPSGGLGGIFDTVRRAMGGK